MHVNLIMNCVNVPYKPYTMRRIVKLKKSSVFCSHNLWIFLWLGLDTYTANSYYCVVLNCFIVYNVSCISRYQYTF